MSVESQKGVITNYSKMFHWEPEGRYCCTKSMAKVPVWFSKGTLLNSSKSFLVLSQQQKNVLFFFFFFFWGGVWVVVCLLKILSTRRYCRPTSMFWTHWCWIVLKKELLETYTVLYCTCIVCTQRLSQFQECSVDTSTNVAWRHQRA